MSTISAEIYVAILFVAMLLLLELGWRLGHRRLREDPGGALAGAMDGAIFALFGLLIAFTFSGAATRFDQRRQMIVQEANDIGTAWLRLDLLPAEARPALRDLFRRYLDSRLETYRKVPDMQAVEAELAQSVKLQGEIWTQAVAACESKGSPAATSLMLSALNAMIDITTTRTMAARTHQPTIIFILLFMLALGCSLLAGFGMVGKARSWVHMLGFAIVTALSIYVIIDLEYPRVGIIRVDAMDQVLVDLRQSMK